MEVSTFYAPLFRAEDIHGDPFELETARRKGPVVLVFCRYPGSAHTRRIGADLVKKLDRLRSMGATVALITEGSAEKARRWSASLPGTVILLPDDGDLYRVYNVGQDPLLGRTLIKSWRRLPGYVATLSYGHGRPGPLTRVPAVFVVAPDRRISWSWQGKTALDRPDFDAVCSAVSATK